MRTAMRALWPRATWIAALLAAAANAELAADDKPPRDPAQIFATTCGWCHHKGGREAGKGPQLMGTALSDAEIATRIRKGKQGYMPAFEGMFSDEEIRGLIGYIRSLRPR